MVDPKRVIVFPGEDASPEAVLPSLDVLKSFRLSIDYRIPELDEAELSEGIVSDELQEQIRSADAVLFGAGSRLALPILLYLRWGLDNYANIRPTFYIEGTRSRLSDPTKIDYVMVRENLEELYPGREGEFAELLEALPHVEDITGTKISELSRDGRYALRIITEKYSRKIAQFTVEVAQKRQSKGYPGRVACFTKKNMLQQTDGLFESVVHEVVAGAGFEYEHYIVDDAARRLVMSPEQFDVIVTPNLYGDVLSDLGSATVGGLGLAPSACYGGETAYFEPVHGTAPDIAGKNIINPTATLLSASMMLEHLGSIAEAQSLEKAIRMVYKEGTVLPVDQGGSATTSEFCEQVKLFI